MRFVDHTGSVFNRLTVLSRAPNRGRRIAWNCQCSCGNAHVVLAENITDNTTKSCGCLRDEWIPPSRRTHGLVGTPTYYIWAAMWRRCRDPNASGFADYGGRGIKVCDRWKSPENFLADMGARPTGLTIERLNTNGDYEPSNCTWATYTVQNRNRRSNVIVSLNGAMMCVAEVLERLGLPWHEYMNRRKRRTIPAQQVIDYLVCRSLQSEVW